MASSLPLAACACCGLVQQVPAAAPPRRAVCARCSTALDDVRDRSRSHARTAALALSALLLFPVAISLPIMHVERLGVSHAASIWSGSIELLADGQLFVGAVVLLCSIVLPLLKLGGLLLLSGGGLLHRPHLAARTWKLVEATGRWGMLDVLLVAVLVATLKLGEVTELHTGPGALAFTGCVLLNLLASASFHPHSLWSQPT